MGVNLRESLNNQRQFKGISTNEYVECMAKLAVIKENKFKVKTKVNSNILTWKFFIQVSFFNSL